ncbi:MAG TPA: VWA domain-containing protein [Pirellulales bacterium]|nr:VWA domain-containing protein [Pirellulales bacterium]
MLSRFALSMTLLASATLAFGSKAVDAAEYATMDTFVDPASDEGYFALSLSPNVAQPETSAHDLVVLFDTSASQAGDYRARALEALAGFLEALPPNDRVDLWAVDVNAVRLTNDFVAPQSPELNAALAQLERRVPLGSTDMDAAINAIITSFNGPPVAGRARAAVYLGDGLSSSHLVTADRLRQFAERCTSGKIPVTCYAIGPRLDGQLMGALANATGGSVLFDEDEEQSSANAAGRQLADAVRGWVIWPDKLSLPAGFQPVYYRDARPLRFDRSTVLLGTFKPGNKVLGQVNVTLRGTLAGKPLEMKWQITPRQSSDDQAYLAQLVELARHDKGVSLPTAGAPALEEVRQLMAAGAHYLARLGRQAATVGDFASARQLADQAARLDPSDQEALILQRAAANKQPLTKTASFVQRARKDDPTATDDAPPREADDGELLDEIERQRRVVAGFLKAEVRNALNQARSRMATDPQGAGDSLKLLLDKVQHTSEAGPELRAQLSDQIEAALRAVNRQAVVQSETELQRQQVIAEGEARERINRELFLQEQKVDQLMQRFNALMDEERFRDAEALADIAEELKPGRAGLRGAELTARMVGWTADMTQIRDMRHKGYVDATMQIELAHVPTSDEPPILYPDPEVWQLLTERRKKYKAVDLKSNGPTEEAILAALDEKTELDFAEQPLSDVIDYLKQRHDIEIQLDQKALTDAGVGSDTPITRSIKGITLRSALKLILSELDLTYLIRNEVLMITSKTEAESMLTTRVYPVADLVIPVAPLIMRGMGGRF